MSTSSEKLKELHAAIKALEAERAELYHASVAAPEAEKLCPDWMAEMLAEPPRFLEYPITVAGITNTPAPSIRYSTGRAKSGAYVAVRPCGPEFGGQTYLGVLLGDIATGASASFDPKTGVLAVGLNFHNPAIWVPDFSRLVFGMESWWGVIESLEDFKQITAADISNIWYVKAMRELEARGR